MAENLLVEKRNQVAIVILNRPELRNAFDDALIASLTRAFEDIEADDAVRAMILMGNGSAFCAGADLNWMKRMAGYTREQNFADAMALARMLAALDRMSKPTIARVHGPCYAGGMGLVCACDIALGSHEAEFSLTEVKLGLSPATISPYVVRAMGARMARRYFLSGERIDAGEAFRLRLLADVTPLEELDDAINALLGQLFLGGRAAQANSKQLIRRVAGAALDDALIAETAERIAEIRVSPEGKQGIAAFLEKRKPSWVAQAKFSRKKKK